ncbi:hypothetical protein Prudu_003113, partial [Prunus dulcis]
PKKKKKRQVRSLNRKNSSLSKTHSSEKRLKATVNDGAKGVDSETVKGRSSGRGRREAVFVGSGRFHLWSKAHKDRTDTLRLFNNHHLEMGSNVELVWPESEAYSSRVNNCSHANSSLAAIRAKLSAEQLEQFKTSCFGHLLNIDKIQFSGQIVHGVVLRRVAGQGVKDLDGLSFLIGCDVAQFTRQDFCLITGLRFGEVPETKELHNALEEAFLRCTEEDDIYKLALVYFAELVVLGRDKHLNINLNYLTLVEDLDAFNRGRGKGKSKVTGTSRRNEKGKKDKHGEAQRGGWSFKGFTYAFQSVQLRALCPSEEEMRQPYWSWPQDRPAVVSAESIPSSCADLDELNKVEVRRDLALLKERTNRCVISHLFKGSEEMDDIQWDEGPSNRNEGEEKKMKGLKGVKGQVIEMRERKRKRRGLKG